MIDFMMITIIALCVSVAAPLALIPLLDRAGLLDVPNDRSSHSHRVLRGGGVAQLLGMTAALTTAIIMLPSPSPERLWPVLVASLTSGGLGLFEDLRGLPIAVRAGTQAAIGGVTVLACAAIWDDPLWWALVGIVAVVGLVNVANFMDGVNVMPAVHGVIAGGAFAVVGALNNRDWLIAAGLVLGAAFLGFVPWNVHGRIFLGDVGSYLFGGTAATIIVIGAMDGLPLIALAAPFTIYVADTGITLASRIAAREQWYEAHRDHTYQRLNRRGLSHLTVTGVVAAASLTSATLGLIAASSTRAVSAICIGGIVIVVAAYTAARFTIADSDERKSA